jgi:hypothetical protein
MLITKSSLGSRHPLRAPLRGGRLYAILDGTSYTDLAGALAQSGLEYDSLFFGDDAVALAGEAPYICALDPTRATACRDLLQAALYRHAGFLIESDATLDTLRRHWKNWLTAEINEGSDMALFRFYDARILLAFVATLGPVEASAFFGPSNRLVALNALEPVALNLTTVVPASARRGLPKTQVYQVNDNQMAVFSAVTDDVFRTRLKSYLVEMFPEKGKNLKQPELDALIGNAINDCGRLGVCREGDVVAMAVARLLRPELVADEAYWEAVLKQRPNPNQRAGAFLDEIVYEMDREEEQGFFAKMTHWFDYGKEAAE